MLTGLLSGLSGSREDLFQAIKRNEGLFPGSTSYRNNNPGNLRAYRSDQPVDSRGFRIFNSMAEGEAALWSQIDLNISRGLTLSEFFNGKPGVYAGYDHTDPAYASKVAQWTGLDLNTPLSQSVGGGGGGGPYIMPGSTFDIYAPVDEPEPAPGTNERRLHVPYDEWGNPTTTQPPAPGTPGAPGGGLSTSTMLLLAGVGLLGFVAFTER